MPVIEVSEELQKKLKAIAAWHDLTEASAVEKLADNEMQRLKPVLRLKAFLQKKIERLESANVPPRICESRCACRCA